MAYPPQSPYYPQGPQPGWGPGQPGYLFNGPPPAPTYQPQSTWGGIDYYRAHASSQYDPTLFNNAWDRVRHFDFQNPGGAHVGIHEARHWHRRAYGGAGELSMMSPVEIGHAAAYEAYRTWMHNRSMYEPLGPDIERQREGLIGLAVAEASRLISFAGRASMDPYARTAASEAAAQTASFIFYQRRQGDESDAYYRDHRRGRSRSRYDDEYGRDYDDIDDLYRYDDEGFDGAYGRHGRSRSRARARSMSRPRSYSGSHLGYEGTPYPQPGMPLGAPYPGSYAGSAVGGMPGVPMGPGYPHQPGFYPGAYPGAGPYGGQIAYPGGSTVPMPLGHSSSTSSGYSGYGGYMPGGVPMGTAMSQGSMGGMQMGQAPPQTIVIHKSRRHKHNRRSRSRSV